MFSHWVVISGTCKVRQNCLNYGWGVNYLDCWGFVQELSGYLCWTCSSVLVYPPFVYGLPRLALTNIINLPRVRLEILGLFGFDLAWFACLLIHDWVGPRFSGLQFRDQVEACFRIKLTHARVVTCLLLDQVRHVFRKFFFETKMNYFTNIRSMPTLATCAYFVTFFVNVLLIAGLTWWNSVLITRMHSLKSMESS